MTRRRRLPFDTVPAEVVFEPAGVGDGEEPGERHARFRGRVVEWAKCWDAIRRERVRSPPLILLEDRGDGLGVAVTLRGARHGNSLRRSSHRDMDAARKSIEGWVAKRFRMEKTSVIDMATYGGLSEDELKVISILQEKPREFAAILSEFGANAHGDVLERVLRSMQDRRWIVRDVAMGNTKATKYRIRPKG